MSDSDTPNDRGSDESGDFRTTAIQIAIVLGTAILLGGILWIDWPVPSYSFDESDIDSTTDERIVASHDFSFARPRNPDIAAARDAARERVRPVWEYDISEQQVVASRIRPAFYPIRCRLYQAAQNAAAPSGDLEDPLFDDDDGAQARSEDEASQSNGPTNTEQQSSNDGGDENAQVVDCGNGDANNVLSSQRRRELVCTPTVRSNFAEKLRIDEFSESLCHKLADAGFSSDIEAALRETTLDLMERQIVASRAGLQEAGARGILLQTTLAGEVNSEEVVTNYDRFVELSAARELAQERPLRSAESIEDDDVREAIRALAGKMLKPNTQLNEARTTAAREDAAGSVVSGSERVNFHRGELILPEGGVLTAETIEILDQMRATAPQSPPRGLMVLGTLGILGLFLSGFLMYSSSRRIRWNTKDLGLTATVLVVQTLVTKVSILVSESLVEGELDLTVDVFLAAIPFAAGAMVIRILTQANNALAFTVLYSILVGAMLDLQLIWVAYAVIACTFGAAAVRSATSRTDILRASFMVGFSMVAVTVCSALLGTISPGAKPWAVALAAFSSGITTALLVNALLPLMELTFRYTTPIKLLELANLNQPLLKDLVLKAPGTYHHSMMVAQLVEAGCEAVGADTLLGRVGAYYHDIGKMDRPEYFAENQKGENPHDKLKPNMSMMAIKRHVKDGAKMAKAHNLPPEIIAFINEHHGTSLIEYFYRKAEEMHPEQVREDDYRYNGPKPQTRETAICMLADGIEAASRALPDKSPSHIKGLVNKMINKAFSDGQLDHCDLTLRDLHEIARAFINRLLAMHHQRPQYPGGKKKPDTSKHDAVSEVDGSRGNKEDEERTDGDSSEKSEGSDDAESDDSSNSGEGSDDGGGGDSEDEDTPSLRRLGI